MPVTHPHKEQWTLHCTDNHHSVSLALTATTSLPLLKSLGINADAKTSSGSCPVTILGTSKFSSLKASCLMLSSPLASSSLLRREVWKYFKSSSLANCYAWWFTLSCTCSLGNRRKPKRKPREYVNMPSFCKILRLRYQGNSCNGVENITDRSW